MTTLYDTAAALAVTAEDLTGKPGAAAGSGAALAGICAKAAQHHATGEHPAVPGAVYLAARYSRRRELCRYRADLAALGITVTSRWLNGNHQLDDHGVPIGETGERLFQADSTAVPRLRRLFAEHDRDDVLAAGMLVAFTEPPRSCATRGGRHVELGLALGYGKRVAIIGPRENVFCWLPQVEHYASWPDFLAALSRGPVMACGCGYDYCSACAGYEWVCLRCGQEFFGPARDGALCPPCRRGGQ